MPSSNIFREKYFLKIPDNFPFHRVRAVPKIQVSARNRASTENNFADTEVEELIAMLRETENLEEQGDILQYLVDTQGLDYNTGMHMSRLTMVIELIPPISLSIIILCIDFVCVFSVIPFCYVWYIL